MRIDFHNLPYCDPYEYWCQRCCTLNFAMVDLQRCPVCSELITLRGKPGELDAEKLRKEALHEPA